jgi:hypothetical protein
VDKSLLGRWVGFLQYHGSELLGFRGPAAGSDRAAHVTLANFNESRNNFKQHRNIRLEKEINSTNGFSRCSSTNPCKIFSFGSDVVEIQIKL